MKRVRCPKCDGYISFDETRYEVGSSLHFQCPHCGKEFGIKLGISKLHSQRRDADPEKEAGDMPVGSILVIENVFHYKQVFPLKMGRNVIGKYIKGTTIACPIETSDPSIDHQHCAIEVSKDKKGALRYTLTDGPSYTGTFVDNQLLGDRERRIITNGTLFTLGATSIILRTTDEE